MLFIVMMSRVFLHIMSRENLMTEDTRPRRWPRLRVRTAWTIALLLVATIAAGGQVASKPDMVLRKVRLRGGDDVIVNPGGAVNVRDKSAGVAPPATTRTAGRPARPR